MLKETHTQIEKMLSLAETSATISEFNQFAECAIVPRFFLHRTPLIIHRKHIHNSIYMRFLLCVYLLHSHEIVAILMSSSLFVSFKFAPSLLLLILRFFFTHSVLYYIYFLLYTRSDCSGVGIIAYTSYCFVQCAAFVSVNYPSHSQSNRN